jgi:hypothetical protein
MMLQQGTTRISDVITVQVVPLVSGAIAVKLPRSGRKPVHEPGRKPSPAGIGSPGTIGS